jgi:hypothetical protein
VRRLDTPAVSRPCDLLHLAYFTPVGLQPVNREHDMRGYSPNEKEMISSSYFVKVAAVSHGNLIS